MLEHAKDLLDGLWLITTGLMVILWSFMQRDRNKIDKDILALIERDKHIEQLAQKALERADGLEKNYIERFNKVHDHLHDVQLTLMSNINDLRTAFVTGYISRTEYDTRHKEILDALNSMKG
jgi:hypothetical protein